MFSLNRAHAELTAAAVLIGSSVVVGKLAALRLPVFLSQAACLAAALLVLVPAVAIRKERLRIRREDALPLLLQALFGMFLFRVLMLYGLQTVTAAESGILTSLTPVSIALLSFLFLGEKGTIRTAAAIVLSLAGLAMLKLPDYLTAGTNPGPKGGWFGMVLILLAIACEAMLTVLRKKSSSRVSALLGAMYVTLFAFLMFLPLAMVEAARYDYSRIDWVDIAIVLYYGIFVTALAYILWFRGVSQVSAATAAVYTGFIPVSTLLLSYGLLHEPFRYIHVWGFSLVLAGMLLVTKGPGTAESTRLRSQ